MITGFDGRRALGAVFLLLATGAGVPAQAQEVLPFSDFHQVAVQSGMRVEIREGDAFRVAVDGPQDSLDRLRVDRSGDRLRFSMEPRIGWLWWLGPGSGGRDIDILIEMPVLTVLSLSGGSRGTVRMDRPTDRIQMSLSGGSRLEGTLDARSMELSLSGGSQVTLAGQAGQLEVSASGGSRLDAGSLASGRVGARMSGGSRATVTTGGPIDASLSGGSRLHYHGESALGRISTSGGSRVGPAN